MKAIAEHTAPLEAGIAQHAVRIAELENVVRALVETQGHVMAEGSHTSPAARKRQCSDVLSCGSARISSWR